MAPPESHLAASAVSGQTPPAGPQWLRGLEPLAPHALAYDKPLCVSLDGFTLDAATRAGAFDPVGREALGNFADSVKEFLVSMVVRFSSGGARREWIPAPAGRAPLRGYACVSDPA